MKHTEESLKAMSDEELAIVAAGCMGWHVETDGEFMDGYFQLSPNQRMMIDKDGVKHCYATDYNPSRDPAQVLELAEHVRRVRDKWIAYTIVSPQSVAAPGETDADVFDVMFAVDGTPIDCSDPSFAKALTICSVLAHQFATKNGEGS